VEVRPAKKEDFPFLLEIQKGHKFPLPEFNNILDILVVEDKGKIVAWGYTKKFVEIVFIPEESASNITKVKSLKLLSEKSTEITRARGIDMVHSFVEDDRLAKLLVERFNYGVCTGTPLYLDLENNG